MSSVTSFLLFLLLNSSCEFQAMGFPQRLLLQTQFALLSFSLQTVRSSRPTPPPRSPFYSFSPPTQTSMKGASRASFSFTIPSFHTISLSEAVSASEVLLVTLATARQPLQMIVDQYSCLRDCNICLSSSAALGAALYSERTRIIKEVHHFIRL